MNILIKMTVRFPLLDGDGGNYSVRAKCQTINPISKYLTYAEIGVAIQQLAGELKKVSNIVGFSIIEGGYAFPKGIPAARFYLDIDIKSLTSFECYFRDVEDEDANKKNGFYVAGKVKLHFEKS